VCHSPKIFTSLSHQERRAPKKPRNLIYKGDTKKETKFVVEKDQEEEKKKKKRKKKKKKFFFKQHTLSSCARFFSLSLLRRRRRRLKKREERKEEEKEYNGGERFNREQSPRERGRGGTGEEKQQNEISSGEK